MWKFSLYIKNISQIKKNCKKSYNFHSFSILLLIYKIYKIWMFCWNSSNRVKFNTTVHCCCQFIYRWIFSHIHNIIYIPSHIYFPCNVIYSENPWKMYSENIIIFKFSILYCEMRCKQKFYNPKNKNNVYDTCTNLISKFMYFKSTILCLTILFLQNLNEVFDEVLIK